MSDANDPELPVPHRDHWVNDIEFYTIKPVLHVDTTGNRLEFEVRRENAATGTAELVAVGKTLRDARRQAHALAQTKSKAPASAEASD